MVSEAKKAANKKWNEAHKDSRRYSSDHSAAKRFIKKATKEDLEGLIKLIKEKLDGLK